jgi:hypothetical protein
VYTTTDTTLRQNDAVAANASLFRVILLSYR